MAGINFDFTGGALPGGITFTRASIGTYNSSGNLLVTAGNDVARFNYIAGVSNLLIEGSATNLLVQSNNFTTTWFPGNAAVVTAAQFVSPDGSSNGWSLSSGTTDGHIVQTTNYSNVPYVISTWVKRMVGANSANFNIAGIGAPFGITTTITRYSFTRTPNAGSNNSIIQIIAAAGNTNGIYGAQLETGSVMTSYIPTTTVAVTRQADSAVFTIPSGIGQLLYTFDDNSTQTVTVSPGPYTIPTTLARANIKSIVGVQVTPGRFQSLSLTANTPVQITTSGTYRLAILNTGPGNLYVSTTATPGANAQSMLVPSLKMAPITTTGAAIWLSADQAGGVSIAMMPR